MVFNLQDAFKERLSKETVRNHLDMRHRLDKDGKRYGKVIDYRHASPDLVNESSILLNFDISDHVYHYKRTSMSAKSSIFTMSVPV
jgi:uncharacterized protein with von Willebrand factor type A (vWA) domain